MLKFLVDHNVPKSVSSFLKKQKYNVRLVKDIDPEMSDSLVVDHAWTEKRIIVTNDKDFLALALEYRPVDVIIFSLPTQDSELRIRHLKSVLPNLVQPCGIIMIE